MTPDDAGLRELVRVQIEPGFYARDTVLEYTQDWAEETGLSPAEANRSVTRMWNERLAVQRTWTTPSDYDRLRTAFEVLERDGILARMCFACCKNCATYEIDDERSVHPDPPDWYRYREWAYTYFHMQDADTLASPGPVELLLGYSAFRTQPGLTDDDGEPDRTNREVACRVVAALRAHGLDAHDPMDPSVRIGVTITDWRKPLPGTEIHRKRRWRR